jgi:hypothetical protein
MADHLGAMRASAATLAVTTFSLLGRAKMAQMFTTYAASRKPMQPIERCTSADGRVSASRDWVWTWLRDMLASSATLSEDRSLHDRRGLLDLLLDAVLFPTKVGVGLDVEKLAVQLGFWVLQDMRGGIFSVLYERWLHGVWAALDTVYQETVATGPNKSLWELSQKLSARLPALRPSPATDTMPAARPSTPRPVATAEATPAAPPKEKKSRRSLSGRSRTPPSKQARFDPVVAMGTAASSGKLAGQVPATGTANRCGVRGCAGALTAGYHKWCAHHSKPEAREGKKLA